MNTKQIRKRIEKAEKELAEAKAMLKQKELTPVPKEIVFREYGDGYELDFGSNQALSYYSAHSSYYVSSREGDCDITQLYLQPCEWEDIKAGEWFYRTDMDEPDFNDSIRYAIKLAQDKYAFADSRGGIEVVGSTWKYSYKLV